MCLRKVNRYLPALCYLQLSIAEFGDWGKAVAHRQVIESIEEIQRRFLIFQGIFMPVVAFDKFHPVGVSKTFVECTDFGVGLMSAFHREEIESGGCYHDRARVHHQ